MKKTINLVFSSSTVTKEKPKTFSPPSSATGPPNEKSASFVAVPDPNKPEKSPLLFCVAGLFEVAALA